MSSTGGGRLGALRDYAQATVIVMPRYKVHVSAAVGIVDVAGVVNVSRFIWSN